MAWTIELTATAAKHLARLDRTDSRRIVGFLRERVASLEDPRMLGKALTGARLGAYWRYRVGDWRIICDIQDSRLVILVVALGNRSDVYR